MQTIVVSRQKILEGTTYVTRKKKMEKENREIHKGTTNKGYLYLDVTYMSTLV